MLVPGPPSHLAGYADVEQIDNGRRCHLRSSAEGRLFRVAVSGMWDDDEGDVGMVYADFERPMLVLATAVDTGEVVVVFDGGRYGYEAMVTDHFDREMLDAREIDFHVEFDGQSDLEAEVVVVEDVPWDVEEDMLRDDAGVLRTVTGEEITPERLRTDAYVWVTITVTTPDGRRFEVVSDELA